MERRLAAILAADVVGYSRLMAADEAGTHAHLKERRRHVIEPLIGEHRGCVVKLTGDGLLAEFTSVRDAVECAVAVQTAMAEHEEGFAESQRVLLRIGISLGDVIHDEGDLYGDGVNIAARLEALAEPGGIAVADHAMQVLDATLRALFAAGERCSLKNIPRPIRVWRWPAASPHRKSPAPVHTERPTVAVLRFDDLSPARDRGYLCQGIADDLITELSRFRSLFVIDRNSSFARRSDLDSSVVARELGAQFLLYGSVQVSGERMRIKAQLVNATGNQQVWAQRFDRPFSDLFDVQDEVVGSIVGTMVGRLEDAVARAARRKPPENLAAYDLVLQGTELLHRHDRDDDEKARELFRQAIDLDADYALAHVRLAQTYLNQFFWDDAGTTLSEAHRHARRALQIDDTEGWSHLIIGIARLHERNFASVEHHLMRALDLNPNDATLERFPIRWKIAGVGEVAGAFCR